MKKLILLASLALLICGCTEGFDDSVLNRRIDSLEQQLSALETVMRAYENKLTITSVEELDNGYIITFSDGSTATTDGKDGVDGDTLIQSIVVTNTEVTFKLTDGREFSIPFTQEVEFAINFDTTNVAVLDGGQSTTISYTITGATDNTIVKTLSQDGWKAQVNATSTSAGTITITAPDPIVDSEILVLANDGSYHTLMVTIDCAKGVITTANDSAEIGTNGGAYEIKLQTNMSFTVDIQENSKEWISVAKTRAMRDETLTFTIAPNTGLSRFATVVLRDSQNNPLQTLVFKQLGVATEIHVDTKGGLEKVLADYDYANMESLKITGVLNDVDFLFIYRMMPNLRNLDISDVEITAFPTQAFYNSKNVEYLILPNTLTIIGKEMFYKSVLKEVFIPKSVETIESAAFNGCSSLATVTFEKGSQLKTIGGGYSFYSSYGAFSDCSSLVSIEIPASVETIEAAAFKGCSSLATVTFEKGSQLKTIGGGYFCYDDFPYSYSYGAFSDCSSLVSIEIPASVETIEAAAFKGCSSLATVTFEKGSQLKTIGGGYYSSSYYGAFSSYGAFCELNNLMTVDMSECTQVESIGAYAFYGDNELRLFMIGTETPPTCESYAFEGINPYSVLKVPSGCANAYKTESGWSKFASISGLDE